MADDPQIAEVLENILTEDKNMIPEYAKYFWEETKAAAEAVGM